MIEIHCSGTPYEIGLKHGKAAKPQIHSSIEFYADLFQKTASLSWPQVLKLASTFETNIGQKWPSLLEEMTGIAAGADLTVHDILALNARTEITFGLFTDGCTSVSLKNGASDSTILAQNWDWMSAQAPNIVLLHISQPGKPAFKTLCEAGQLTKIGFNEHGVGVCFNALKAKGMDPTRLPAHLALRTALEKRSAAEAERYLESFGAASSFFMLLADAKTAIGFEWSSTGVQKIPRDESGRVWHANHMLKEQAGIEDTQWVKDSIPRTKRIEELSRPLVRTEGELEVSKVVEIFKDEQGLPGAINRVEEEPSTAATLFNIVMRLKKRGSEAFVTLGRPTEPEGSFKLTF